jgi:hypothetical protein
MGAQSPRNQQTNANYFAPMNLRAKRVLEDVQAELLAFGIPFSVYHQEVMCCGVKLFEVFDYSLYYISCAALNVILLCLFDAIPSDYMEYFVELYHVSQPIVLVIHVLGIGSMLCYFHKCSLCNILSCP